MPDRDIFENGLPSNFTCPLSDSNNPTKHFSNTVFPMPLCPIIRFVLPFSKDTFTCSNTQRSPNFFDMSIPSIMTAAVG